MLNLYVTSTNKYEGKTFLSAGLAGTMQSLGYSTAVYKPIQTGCKELNGFLQSSDLTYVKTVDPYINTGFTYLFKTQAEPLIAAENNNEYIDLDNIQTDFLKITSTNECTIVDGNGALLSPIAQDLQNADLIKRIQTPLLIVTQPDNDAINRALLSIFTAKEKGLMVNGVIINNITQDCSKKLLTAMTRVIEEYSGASILGLLPHLGEKVKPEDLINGILNGIDIESVFKVKIEKLELN